MNKYFLVFIVILFIIFLFLNYIDAYKEVSFIIDGDTIKLKNGKIVRFIGINAPELNKLCYNEAKEKLEELVKGKIVKLEKDVRDKDVYGRLLRYVFINDLFVNSEMIRLGLAKFEEIKPNTKYSSLFLEMENKARKARRCIWK